VYNFVHKNPFANYVPFFLSLLNYLYDEHSYVYTNGSETANNVGCGMNIENLKFSTQHR